MHDRGSEYDPWAEYRARRAEWKARRHERREAWREAWRARRAERRARWAQWGMGHGWHMGAHDCGQAGPAPEAERSESVAALKATVADMQKTIGQLLSRVAVLEKLAVDDDAKLAREIEKLRETDPRT